MALPWVRLALKTVSQESQKLNRSFHCGFDRTNVNCGLNALDGKDGPRKPCSGADRGHRNCGLCSNVVQRHRLTGGDLPADYTDDLKWAMYYATKACQTSGGYPVIMITHVAPGKAQEMDDVVNYKRSPGMHAVYRPKSREWMVSLLHMTSWKAAETHLAKRSR